MFEKLGDAVLVGVGEGVPCNGCVACCKHEVVVLFPEKGDDPSQYDCVEIEIEGVVEKRHALRHKDNGDCVYLGEKGCTIYDRTPAVCREFDCRTYFLAMDRNERRLHIRKGEDGINNRVEIFEAARKRLHTLTPEQRVLAMHIRANNTLPKPDVAAKEGRRFAEEFKRGVPLKKP